MTTTTKIALAVGLGISMIAHAQQNPQPQPAQKTENPCAPRQESSVERQVKAKARGILGGLLIKGNGRIQKGTQGNAPVITPNELPGQAPKPCNTAPAVTTPPQINK